MLCDDSELYNATIWCSLAILLLQTMCVCRLQPLLFTNNFRPQINFYLGVTWHRCNYLWTRNIVVREKSRNLAISDKLVVASIMSS